VNLQYRASKKAVARAQHGAVAGSQEDKICRERSAHDDYFGGSGVRYGMGTAGALWRSCA